jgi:WD40 repeat protein
MTTRMEFDDQLRAWAELGDERLPVQYLNAALAQIDASPQRRSRPAWLAFPPMHRFAPFALAATALIVIALIGISLLVRSPNVGPTPVPAPSNDATPNPDATPEAGAPLGGGYILAYQPHESKLECPFSSQAPYDLLMVDPGTGAHTLLGTVAEDCSARFLTLQWSPDRSHVLMTDEFGLAQETLDAPTAAGRELTFICCDMPADLMEGGGSGALGWVLSPGGDRAAAVHTTSVASPGGEGTLGGIGDGIVVAAVDGSGQATLSIPAGASIRGSVSWSPDQTALVAAGCVPCNHAGPGEPASGENREHIWVVPVDGSPVRELLDVTAGWFWTPIWSPDASSFAMVRRTCDSGEVPPQCDSGVIASTLQLISAEDGSVRDLVTSEQVGEGRGEFGLPAWSGDSTRIAFSAFTLTTLDPPHVFVVEADGGNLVDIGEGEPLQWSPDGEWLLVSRPAAGDGMIELWVMRPDGSGARSLGTFMGSFRFPAAW